MMLLFSRVFGTFDEVKVVATVQFRIQLVLLLLEVAPVGRDWEGRMMKRKDEGG